MNRYALYARYSSEGQNEKSTADQFHDCEKHIHGKGTIVAHYEDKAVSGASRHRPGFQRLLKDASERKFDYILAEALDRLSRDQEDTAYLYKHCTFYGVKLVTLSEGEINELHVGLTGTMNAMFLKELSRKTKRGLEATLRAGKNRGSRAYGYDVIRELMPDGAVLRGLLKIDELEAKIVHRIFVEFSEGRSPLEIARKLNAEGVPGPSGKPWRDSSIRGDRKAGSGILNHQLYIGKRIYNRKANFKNPTTGRTVSRLNPENKWLIHDAPELRIISDNLWKSVQARIQDITENTSNQCKSNKLTGCRRVRYFLSGVLFCAECGSRYSLGSRERYNCSSHKLSHRCTNGKSIRRPVIENKILSLLAEKLLRPDIVDAFLDEYQRYRQQIERESEQAQASTRKEIQRINQGLEKIVDAIEQGIVTESTKTRLQELEAKRDLLQNTIVERAPVSMPDKKLIVSYHKLIANLSDAINDDKIKYEAINTLRPLIDKIVLHPSDNGLRAEFFGNLSGLIAKRTDDGFFLPESQISECLGTEMHRYLTLPAIWIELPFCQGQRPLQH